MFLGRVENPLYRSEMILFVRRDFNPAFLMNIYNNSMDRLREYYIILL